MQSFKHLFKYFQMLFMSGRVDEQIIDIDNDIGDVPHNAFHKTLKAGRAARQPSSPIGDVIQWYCPFPGIVNAVRG